MGLTVALDRTEYFISGVFKSKSKTLLYPAQSGFTHAALRGLSPDTPKTDAEQWAAATGAGKITAITYGPQKAWLAQAACALPALIVGLALVVLLLRFICAPPVSCTGSPVCFSTGICVGGTPFSANPARLAYPRPLE